MSPRERAQLGLREIEQAILDLLREEPEGLTNAELVSRLGIESDFEGQNRNYLSWSVLGRLLGKGQVRYVGSRQKRRYLASSAST